ncbi:MAG: glycosyltransferase family 4 protein [Candidatus Calescibacterium sp.]|nr:glycosyltransferase family 4 protein [Candidatus Calescibacterium sp.]MCX7733403.1 glycosyltransferase family 4 protein [bacterium]
MKIIFVHNYYQFRGGEDEMADLDTNLLRKKGNQVLFFSRHNNDIKNYDLFQKATLLYEPVFSLKTYYEIKKKIQDFKPDIIHINNFFPLISPSIIYAGAQMKIPVVMSLHDFRIICANGLLLRSSRICEKCFSSPIYGLIYRCYRNSLIQTLPVSLMIFAHQKLKTWTRKITLFISPSGFVKRKFAEFGLDSKRIFVRPNYVEDEFVKTFETSFKNVKKESYILFAGRLSEEKGIKPLLEAWDILRSQNIKIKLKIAGDGRLMRYVKDRAKNNELLEVLGFVKKKDLVELMAKASFTVVPSICYEVFGRSIIESYAVGTPVLASKIGAFEDIVVEGKTGFFFDPEPSAIARKVREVFGRDELIRYLSENSIKEFARNYTEDTAYKRLISLYEEAIRFNESLVV